MGVVLLSCITKKETTKARAMSCCSLVTLLGRLFRMAQSAVANGSAAYLSTTAALHEYFGQTRSTPPRVRSCSSSAASARGGDAQRPRARPATPPHS